MDELTFRPATLTDIPAQIALVTSAYRDSYFPPETLSRHGVAMASARAGNAIGGGDWTANQLIPDLQAYGPGAVKISWMSGFLELLDVTEQETAMYLMGRRIDA